MKKRIVSLLLSLGLFCSLASPVMAVEFTDLEGHWAASYINELADRGYLTGYSDGTVKPDRIITACEAIALLTRLYAPSDYAVEQIHADYGSFVSSYVDPNLSWAYDELELCLATGILSKNELKNLRLTSAIDKELLSVLFVRALQLTDEAVELNQSGVELGFVDANDIAKDYRGHIAVLVEAEIINGNSKNQFLPHSQVSRAVVSTMLVRSLEYLEEHNKTLWIDGYDATVVDGVMLDYSNGDLLLRDSYGFLRTYTIPSTASIVTSAGDKALSAAQSGARVRVQIRDGTVVQVTVYNLSDTTVQQAYLLKNTAVDGNQFLQLQNAQSSEKFSLSLPRETAATLPSGASTVAKLQDGMVLTIVRTKSGSVSSISATDATRTVDGVISYVTYGSTVNIFLTDEDGSTVQLVMPLNDLPEILWGTSTISVDRLSAGMNITATAKGATIEKLVVEDTTETIRGTLNTVLATSSGTTWTVVDETGRSHSLTLSPTATITQNGKVILPSAVQAGDTVSIKAMGSSIVAVELLNSTGNSAKKVNGTILSLDTTKKQITLLNSQQRLVYIDVSGTVSYLNGATGQSIRLTDLKVDQAITVYGSYTNTSAFTAATIVLEG